VSTGEFTQLSSSGRITSVIDEITDDELMSVTSMTSADIDSMKSDEKDELKQNFQKIRGVLFDTDPNDHGFAMSSKALEYMGKHFRKTKDVGYLHNFFKDHEFMSVDSMLGRVIDLYYNEKSIQMMYESLLSKKHPLVQRVELMKSVSGTIVRGSLECVKCGDPYTNSFFPKPTCDHVPDGKDVYPITHKAIHIETSFVTFPAYKKTSVEMFQNSSSLASNFREVLEEEFPDSPYLKSEKERQEMLSQLESDITLEDHIEENDEGVNKQELKVMRAALKDMRSNLTEMYSTLVEASKTLPNL